jgi:hypothetical protein
MARGPVQGAVHGGPATMAGRGAYHSGPRWLAARLGKAGGRHRDSILLSTKACKVARRWRIGDATLAQKGDDMGTVGTKRRRVQGMGIFTGGGATFYRLEAWRGRPGSFNGRY